MNVCIFTILSCLVLCLSHTTSALGWGAIAQAVIGQLVEDELLTNDTPLRTLLTRFRDPTQYQHVHNEAQERITREHMYPSDDVVGPAYLQRYHPTIHLQVLRAAVRLAAMLRQSM